MSRRVAAAELIRECTAKGINLRASASAIGIAPRAALTRELKRRIQALKPELIELLLATDDRLTDEQRRAVEHEFLRERGWHEDKERPGLWRHPRIGDAWPEWDALTCERESAVPLSKDTWPDTAGHRSTDQHYAKAIA